MSPLGIVFVLAFIMILLGTLLIFLSLIRESRVGESRGRFEGGGVLIVGPLPIVFGTTERVTKLLIILAIVLLLVSVISFVLVTGVLK